MVMHFCVFLCCIQCPYFKCCSILKIIPATTVFVFMYLFRVFRIFKITIFLHYFISYLFLSFFVFFPPLYFFPFSLFSFAGTHARTHPPTYTHFFISYYIFLLVFFLLSFFISFLSFSPLTTIFSAVTAYLYNFLCIVFLLVCCYQIYQGNRK